MTDESKASKIEGIATAVATVAEKIPVYPDLVQPVAKEVGKALSTAVGALNVVLGPLRALTMAGNAFNERLEAWLTKCAQARAPNAKLLEPPPNVAGPALLAMTWSVDQEELRRLYVNLLVSSMLEGCRDTVHPAFVPIIQQLTPREASYLGDLLGGAALRLSIYDEKKDGQTFGGHMLQLGTHFLSEAEIQNFLRLQLISIEYDLEVTDDESYAPLEEEFRIRRELFAEGAKRSDEPHVKLVAERCLFNVTVFGVNFRDACVSNEEWTF